MTCKLLKHQLLHHRVDGTALTQIPKQTMLIMPMVSPRLTHPVLKFISVFCLGCRVLVCAL